MTASVYNLRNQQRLSDDTRILVMRTWPRGIARKEIDIWVPDAGPSLDLLRSYRDEQIDWEQFAAAYIAEQQALTRVNYTLYGAYTIGWKEGVVAQPQRLWRPESPIEYLRFLKGLVAAEGKAITLCCWERQGNCHRHILQQLVEGENS
jgi:hypothetical protein